MYAISFFLFVFYNRFYDCLCTIVLSGIYMYLRVICAWGSEQNEIGDRYLYRIYYI